MGKVALTSNSLSIKGLRRSLWERKSEVYQHAFISDGRSKIAKKVYHINEGI